MVLSWTVGVQEVQGYLIDHHFSGSSTDDRGVVGFDQDEGKQWTQDLWVTSRLNTVKNQQSRTCLWNEDDLNLGRETFYLVLIVRRQLEYTVDTPSLLDYSQWNTEIFNKTCMFYFDNIDNVSRILEFSQPLEQRTYTYLIRSDKIHFCRSRTVSSYVTKYGVETPI